MQPNDTPLPDTKTCTKCGETQSIDAFLPRHGRPNQTTSQCRTCESERTRLWHQANAQHVADRYRRRLIENPDAKHAATKRWKSNNKHRNAISSLASKKVSKAIKAGILLRPTTCEQCGGTGKQITAAHHDYSKPLDVRWLCRSCHSRWDHATPKTLTV